MTATLATHAVGAQGWSVLLRLERTGVGCILDFVAILQFPVYKPLEFSPKKEKLDGECYHGL